MRNNLLLFLLIISFSTCINAQKLDSLKNILPQNSNIEKVDILNAIANESKYISTDSVLYYSEKALKLAEDLVYYPGQACAYANFAFIYTYNGDKDKAINFIQKAISTDKLTNDKGNEAEHNIFFANIRMQFEDYELASEKYIAALKYFEETKDTFRIAQIKGNLGILYGIIEDLNTSLKYFKESANLKKQINDSYGEAITYSNIGHLLYINKQYSEAISYNNKALIYYVENNKISNLIQVYSNLGNCYFELGNYKEALSYQKLSLEYATKAGNTLGYGGNFNHIAEIYFKLNQYENGKKSLEQALEFIKKTNNQIDLAKNYKLFHYYYILKNNANKALEYFEKYETLKDSIKSLEKHEQVADLRIKYESEKKEIENELLKTNLEAETQENQLQTKLTLTISILLLLLVISSIFIYRSLKHKNELLAKENRIKEIEKETIKQETIAKQQVEFSRKLIENQEEERERIAGELHDGIGQDLIIANNKILLGMKETETEKTTELLGAASEYLNKLSDDVSRISHDLHPQELTQLGFGLAIESMINRLSEISNINFDIQIDDVNNLLDKEEEINYFRIIQEALNNIVKHSEAENVWINISKETDNILMEIKDNGKGFDLNKNDGTNGGRPHFGLRSMSQRANLIGGELKIESELNVGTTIRIKIGNGKNS